MRRKLHEHSVFCTLGATQVAAGEHESSRRWLKVADEHRRARASGLAIAIIFGDAQYQDEAGPLYGWAMLDSVEVDQSGTRIRFSGVRDLEGHQFSELIKESDGQPLTYIVRRGYTVVKTPSFLVGESSQLVDAEERAMLARLCRDGGPISNSRLMEALGWGEARYKQVRDRLVKQGAIVRGTGQGGTVRLASKKDSKGERSDQSAAPGMKSSGSGTVSRTQGSVEGGGTSLPGAEVIGGRQPRTGKQPTIEHPVRLFVACSHKDEDLRRDLDTHLQILERNGEVESWCYRNIGAGEEWRGVIDARLQDAEIILLLVSKDLLASDYCRDNEMRVALKRHADGKAIVIPVILRHCLWQITDFGRLQALPTGAEPVVAWTHLDQAMTDIVQGVRAAAEKVRAKR